MPVRERCERIIEVATSLLGCHYLWGAAGASPGGSEGITRRPGSVSLATARLDPNNPAVFAAECSVDGRHVCGGRWDAANGGIAGGRDANPTDADLIAYLAGLGLIPPALWQPYFLYFSPRVAEGRTVPRRSVWGEDCRGKQHFDCVGFINYCIEVALDRSREVQYSIAQWGADLSGTTAVPLTAPPHPADILITANNTHIGFLVGNGDAAGVGAEVVQAEQTSTGVVRRAYSPGGWAQRRRLTAGILGA